MASHGMTGGALLGIGAQAIPDRFIRQQALEMAIRNATSGEVPKVTTDRAAAFYEFLNQDNPNAPAA